MSIILNEKLIYLKKGFFSDKWEQAVFALYSNGTLCKLDERGKRVQFIDLKAVISHLQIKSLVDYRDEKKRSRSKLTPRSSIKFPNFKSAALDDYRCKYDLNESKLIIIPAKSSSKVNLMLLFIDPARLSDWSKNIYKWASIPKIEIDFFTNGTNHEQGEEDVKTT